MYFHKKIYFSNPFSTYFILLFYLAQYIFLFARESQVPFDETFHVSEHPTETGKGESPFQSRNIEIYSSGITGVYIQSQHYQHLCNTLKLINSYILKKDILSMQLHIPVCLLVVHNYFLSVITTLLLGSSPVLQVSTYLLF